MDVLRDLFDERIIEIINLFIRNPEKQYSLSEVANTTKINITTTFRILNKLVSKNYVKATVIGKIRVYQLEKNEKTRNLLGFLKKEGDPLQKFVEEISPHPRIKKIVLESKDGSNAKILMVGDFLPTDKINKLINQIKDKHKFNITFVEISEKQYEGLKNFKNYNLERKIIWDRKKTL